MVACQTWTANWYLRNLRTRWFKCELQLCILETMNLMVLQVAHCQGRLVRNSKLLMYTITLCDCNALSQVHRSHRYIEGFRVKYRRLADKPADVSRQVTSQRLRRGGLMTSLVPRGMASFVLSALQKYTW